MTDELIPAQKRRRVPPKIREAIFLLGQKRTKTLTETAKRVGVTRERLSRALREPHISAYAQEKVSGTLAIAALRAASREVELIDSPSHHVSHEASKHVLAIAGHRPAADHSVRVNLDIRAGYVLDLRESGQPVKPGDIITGTAEPPKIIDVEPVSGD